MPTLVVAMSPSRVDEVMSPKTRAMIAERFDARWADDTFPAQLPELVADADVILTSWGTPPLATGLLVPQGRSPRIVAHAAGSVKKLITAEAMAAGVVAFSGATRIAWSVGEYCLGAILTLLRRLPQFDDLVRAGGWKWPGSAGGELRGRRVGLIGASSTARALITLLQPFGCDLTVYDPYLDADRAAGLGVRTVPLPEALGAGVVSVHLPAIPETENLITADLIAQIPDGAVVVNSARAASVDTAALATAALNGRLSVALDVYDVEPPSLPSDWTACPNLLLTPHVAGDTVEGRRALAGYVLADVLTWIEHGRRGQSFVDPTSWSIAA